jgi:hypothetical protein
VYFPNDHKEGIAFAEKVYLKLLETQTEFPDTLTICAGDFNACMTTDDSMGRNEHAHGHCRRSQMQKQTGLLKRLIMLLS